MRRRPLATAGQVAAKRSAVSEDGAQHGMFVAASASRSCCAWPSLPADGSAARWWRGCASSRWPSWSVGGGEASATLQAKSRPESSLRSGPLRRPTSHSACNMLGGESNIGNGVMRSPKTSDCGHDKLDVNQWAWVKDQIRKPIADPDTHTHTPTQDAQLKQDKLALKPLSSRVRQAVDRR